MDFLTSARFRILKNAVFGPVSKHSVRFYFINFANIDTKKTPLKCVNKITSFYSIQTAVLLYL